MNTKFWGPPGWKFLHTITFNYPTKIDVKDPRHREMKHYYKQLFENFQYTLPCKYCRNSYKQFIRELPIDDYLDSRKGITMWLYLIHNKVNDKLRSQETEQLWKEFRKLRKRGLKGAELESEFQKIKKRIMITKPNPKFSQVCAKYEAHRASCAKKPDEIASCRI